MLRIPRVMSSNSKGHRRLLELVMAVGSKGYHAEVFSEESYPI
jgi:hypothetical protein